MRDGVVERVWLEFGVVDVVGLGISVGNCCGEAVEVIGITSCRR